MSSIKPGRFGFRFFFAATHLPGFYFLCHCFLMRPLNRFLYYNGKPNCLVGISDLES